MTAVLKHELSLLHADVKPKKAETAAPAPARQRYDSRRQELLAGLVLAKHHKALQELAK
jgi:hypothetical protein